MRTFVTILLVSLINIGGLHSQQIIPDIIMWDSIRGLEHLMISKKVMVAGSQRDNYSLDSLDWTMNSKKLQIQSRPDSLPNLLYTVVASSYGNLITRIDSVSFLSLPTDSNSLEYKGEILKHSKLMYMFPVKSYIHPLTSDFSPHEVIAKFSLELPAVESLNIAERKVSDFSERTPSTRETADKTKDYRKDLKKLKESPAEKLKQLPEQGEQQLMEVSAVKSMTGEISLAEAEQAKYAAALQKYRDHKLVQDEIKRKASNVANDYISKNIEKVRQAQQVMPGKKAIAVKDKLKKALGKRTTELDGKKRYQRLVPGVTWQVYNKRKISTDIGLQLGYRLTPRLTVGFGSTYRIAFDKNYEYLAKGLYTNGSRMYIDFMVGKGVFGHVDIERMSLGKEMRFNGSEVLPRVAYGSFIGLGKHVNIARNWRAQVQALYRIEYAGRIPDVNKVSARFGVDYVFRRKINKLKRF